MLFDCKKQGMEKWWHCSELPQGGRLMSRCSKVLIPGKAVSAEGLKNDLEDVD